MRKGSKHTPETLKKMSWGDPKKRFWSRVNKDGPTMPHMKTACWLWTGARNDWGYGVMRLGKRFIYAHRLAYEWNIGVSTGKLLILHACDVPSCVNSAHLWTGTPKDNVRDCSKKGRLRPRGKTEYNCRVS